MKASPLRYVFARDWPLKAYLGLCMGLCLAVSVAACRPRAELFKDWRYDLLFLVAIVVSPVIGFFLALPFIFIVVGPFYRFQAWRNGAPFQPGDRVRILAGPHCGRVTQVRMLWQHNTVRVGLGPVEEETYKDIFSQTQLLREPNVKPGAPTGQPPS